MSSINVEENIKKLFEKHPSLVSVLDVLNKNKIKYGIFAGTAVTLFTSGREPTDIDILVADSDFKKLGTVFNGLYKRKCSASIKSSLFYINNNSVLEFVSELDFIVDGISYPIRLTSLSGKHANKYKVGGVDVVLLDPVDTIIEKAIAPRGPEVGKHDLEDIDALLKSVKIDRGYYVKRATEMKASEKVKDLLQKYSI